MRSLLLLTLAGAALAMASESHARPVSYPGGVTVMTMNDGEVHGFMAHYTPAPTYSLGYGLEYWRGGEFTLNTLMLNVLLKRWNEPASQANLYLKSGLGIALQDGDTEPGGFAGMAADWEDRRFFVSYENRYTEAGGIDDFFMQSARVGVAPYIGDYGDLHTWLMLEGTHNPEGEDNFTLTPLVRLFKGDHLAEAGISNRGDVLFNWTIRF